MKNQKLADPRMIAVDSLLLDAENPRITDEEFTVDDQIPILKELWREKAVNELVESIATNGFWSHETLFAIPHKKKFVVIEGNRRLAAVKILRQPSLVEGRSPSEIPKLSETAKKRLAELPVIVCERRDVWEYLGFKHVNGPQDWDSIAKAEYIARVHNEFGVSLPEIARTIGDKNQTVAKLYEGLMVLKQAERATNFSRDKRWKKRFAYSHLWTGLGYPTIRAFLGLPSERATKINPVPRGRLRELEDFCTWLYGDRSESTEPLIESQNPDLRVLAETLGNSDGVTALRNRMPLYSALKISRGDPRIFRQALLSAEQSLKETKGLIVTGFKGESDLLDRANNILELSESILDEMLEVQKSTRHARTSRKKTKA